MFAATLSAAPLFSLGGYALVGWMSVAITVAGTLLVFTFRRAEIDGGRRDRRSGDTLAARYLASLRAGADEVRTDAVVRRAVVLAAALLACLAFDEYFGLLAREDGASTEFVPVLVASPSSDRSSARQRRARRADGRPDDGCDRDDPARLLSLAGALAGGVAGFVAIGSATAPCTTRRSWPRPGSRRPCRAAPVRRCRPSWGHERDGVGGVVRGVRPRFGVVARRDPRRGGNDAAVRPGSGGRPDASSRRGRGALRKPLTRRPRLPEHVCPFSHFPIRGRCRHGGHRLRVRLHRRLAGDGCRRDHATAAHDGFASVAAARGTLQQASLPLALLNGGVGQLADGSRQLDAAQYNSRTDSRRRTRAVSNSRTDSGNSKAESGNSETAPQISSGVDEVVTRLTGSERCRDR